MEDAARESAARQARAARDTVLAVPLDRAAIVVRGKDRVSWLNGLVTCELAKLGQGAGAYGLLVEKKGRLQTDLYVVPEAGLPAGPGQPGGLDAGAGRTGGAALALAVPRALRDALVATLDHYLIMEDAELETPDLAFFVAVGPRAAELTPLASWAGAIDVLGGGTSGGGGVVLAAPAEEAEALTSRLAEVVSAAGGVMGDDAGWEAMRIERGLPRFGVEVDATLYPQEAALEKLAVSFEKGCYLGQEVVYMLEHRGHVKRKLVPLDVEGELPPALGAPVTTPAGEVVGEVRSAAIGPTRGKPVAIAMVKWAQAKPETELLVGERPARVRAFP